MSQSKLRYYEPEVVWFDCKTAEIHFFDDDDELHKLRLAHDHGIDAYVIDAGLTDAEEERAIEIFERWRPGCGHLED